MPAIVPVKTLGTDGITVTSVAVCGVVPVAAIYSTGIVAGRIPAMCIDGPLIYT